MPPIDLEVEIARVATDLGVSTDVVRAHFALRDEIAGLRAMLAGTPHFAGLWVEHGSELRVVVAFAGTDPEKELDMLAADFSAPELLVAVSAEWTLAELQATMSELIQVRNQARQENGGAQFDLSIDEIANQVVIESTSESSAADAIAKVARPDQIQRTVVHELSKPEDCSRYACDPLILAGLSGSDCTLSFSATRDGILGVLTAGHCLNTQLHNGLTVGPVQAEQFGGNLDVQWHALPSTWSDWTALYVGLPDEQFRRVHSVASAGSDYVGMPVCISGQVSGYDCGTVTGLNYAPGYVGASFNAVFRTADYQHTSGDSGAPIVYAEQAEGIHSGNRGSDNSAIYGHISYAVNELAVTVNTK